LKNCENLKTMKYHMCVKMSVINYVNICVNIVTAQLNLNMSWSLTRSISMASKPFVFEVLLLNPLKQ
jgi:hypothetical protein